MKADYKNWVPTVMVYGCFAGAILFLICTFFLGINDSVVSGTLRWILFAISLIAFIVLAAYSIWSVCAYSAFSYTGKRQLSRQIVEGTAEYITLPDGGKGLDVGCGSGALTIACAKRNSQGTMEGIDHWGLEYAAYNKSRCEQNAEAEGVTNVAFAQGDACKLPYADESFDAVTSNYVYHNIGGVNKQKLLLETLRVLKKGGCFAIHDLMSPRRYGDMEAFTEKLRGMGYEKVELIDTTNGLFMSKAEARKLMLSGSTLLVGRK